MTLCRRGRSVLRRTLVRGLVVTSVIGANLPTTAQLNSASFSHVRNVARNWRRTAAHDLALTQACPIQYARIFQRAKRSRRFERPACSQNKGVRPDRADDLQPDREPVARHSAGNGRRRLLRQVEWTSERRPIRPRLAPLARWRHQTARLERG